MHNFVWKGKSKVLFLGIFLFSEYMYSKSRYKPSSIQSVLNASPIKLWGALHCKVLSWGIYPIMGENKLYSMRMKVSDLFCSFPIALPGQVSPHMISATLAVSGGREFRRRWGQQWHLCTACSDLPFPRETISKKQTHSIGFISSMKWNTTRVVVLNFGIKLCRDESWWVTYPRV